MNRKETFFDYKNKKFYNVSKMAFFQRVNPCFWSKNAIFLNLFSVKKGVEIRFNDVLDRKETFFDYKNKNFLASQKWHFCKGVNRFFWVNNDIFFL